MDLEERATGHEPGPPERSFGRWQQGATHIEELAQAATVERHDVLEHRIDGPGILAGWCLGSDLGQQVLADGLHVRLREPGVELVEERLGRVHGSDLAGPIEVARLVLATGAARAWVVPPDLRHRRPEDQRFEPGASGVVERDPGRSKMPEGLGIVAPVRFVAGDLQKGEEVVRIGIKRRPEQPLGGRDIVACLGTCPEDEPRARRVTACGYRDDARHEWLSKSGTARP